jgi:serine protease Do
MKKLKMFTMVLAVMGMISGYGFQPASAAIDPDVKMIPGNFSQLHQTVREGVVNIRTEKTMKGGGPVFRHFFGNPFGDRNPFEGPYGQNPPEDFKQQSLGSGFIIDREGYIVTNNHVIENADRITVKLSDGKESDAKIIGRDPNTDLALIKIESSRDLHPLRMGDSDALPVGSWVVAIGSPFGLEQTLTAGIVSAKGRVIGAGPYDDFIQTDASINPGNSGGPLLDMQGEVVGINTAIVARGQGIGFAIPANMAREIIGQLKENGEVTRAWLGVAIQDLSPELKAYYSVRDQDGVLVTDVYPGDPADKGGIKAKDIILAVDGKPVSSSRDLSRRVAASPVGKRIPVSILREGKMKTVEISLAKRTDSQLQAKQEPDQKDALGLTLSELDPDTARRLGFSGEEKGVLVMDVKPQSRAAAAGVKRGDLVKEVNRSPVETIGDFQSRLAKADEKEIQLLLKRPNIGFIAIRIA